MDTALLLAGALTGAVYVDRQATDERDIRSLAEALYVQAGWQRVQNGAATVTPKWKPETCRIGFRGIQGEFMRGRGIEYFENTRRAAYVQQLHAMRNPQQYEEYSEHSWGITAVEVW